MKQEEIWDAEVAAGSDTPGTGVLAPEIVGPAVDRLAALAGSGRALEFAIGTGRVAIPLSERGVRSRVSSLLPALSRTDVLDDKKLPIYARHRSWRSIGGLRLQSLSDWPVHTR